MPTLLDTTKQCTPNPFGIYIKVKALNDVAVRVRDLPYHFWDVTSLPTKAFEYKFATPFISNPV
jgi:hypothetical protein